MASLGAFGAVMLGVVTLGVACGGESITEGEAGAGGSGGKATGGSSTGATGGTSTGGTTGGTGNVGADGGTTTGGAGGSGNVGASGGSGGTGNVSAVGGSGNVGATGGMVATGGTGNVGATGGTGNVGAGGSYAGGPCTDTDGSTGDPMGLFTQGTTSGVNGEFTDLCDVEDRLIEYYCYTNCSTAADAAPQRPAPPADGGASGVMAPCNFTGDVLPTIVVCENGCEDGACLPPILR